MSQHEKILAYLLTGQSLSQLEAIHLGFGLRLGARVWDLRKQGHRIIDVSPGMKVNYAIYKLIPAPAVPEQGARGNSSASAESLSLPGGGPCR